MSSRVTRSSAKKSAEPSLSPQTFADQPTSTPTAPSRKRKAANSANTSPDDPRPPSADSSLSRRRSKRAKVAAPAPEPETTTKPSKRKIAAAMSAPGPPSERSQENQPSSPGASAPTSSRRRSSNKGKKAQDSSESAVASPHSPTKQPRSKRRGSKKDASLLKSDENQPETSKSTSAGEPSNSAVEEEDDEGEDVLPAAEQEEGDEEEEEEEEEEGDDDDDMDEDPFASGSFLARSGLSGMSALRALTGMTGFLSGTGSRLRNLLEQLRQRDDPNTQYLALQEVSEILLISTEDNLAGHMSPDAYSKEFITLMGPSIFGDENPEMQLLACRCLANLIEALPASTASVVYNGAVPVLIGKLRDIQYMDLAEQALITLEKISVEFPTSIVREDGLKACLEFLDFFATGVQRTAVTTAANCARNIPEEAFSSVKDIMPILLNVLNSSDQRVVEQGCLCVSRIVESFKSHDRKLEELMSADLLKVILRLLLPGVTNMIGPSIHTQFLRVLSITARASPVLSVELLKMNIVDTLYQILTGVSPPAGNENVAQKIDSVVIMQALIHRPRDQVFETLNVICELLPGLDRDGVGFLYELYEKAGPQGERSVAQSSEAPVKSRKEALKGCREELRRFAIVLFPTLTDAYSSTVNLNVRQKVLSAQLRMLSNLETDLLEDALRTVPYASFLASILSQQDHAFLVTAALQAAELLLRRLESVYSYQFYREGVMAEVKRLAARPLQVSVANQPKASNDNAQVEQVFNSAEHAEAVIPEQGDDNDEQDNDDDNDEAEVDDEDDEDENDDPMDIDEENIEYVGEDNEDDEEESEDDDSPSGTRKPEVTPVSQQAILQDLITRFAIAFVERHDKDSGKQMREKAIGILDDLRALVGDIADAYFNNRPEDGIKLFRRLAQYFEGDALESITSYELLSSKVVSTLLEVFQENDPEVSREARAAFVEVFMGTTVKQSIKTGSSESPSTPFSVLIQKLQDMLSRAEHFEVVTVHQNAFESNRSSAASMLAKQIRIRLVADEDSGIPVSFRNIMVSIHAIANFKSLDEYLRPRIALSERPRRPRDFTDPLSTYERLFNEAVAGRSAGSSGTPATGSSGQTALAERSFAGESRDETNPRESSSRAPGRKGASNVGAISTSENRETSSMRATGKKHKGSSKSPETPLPETQSAGGDLECADEEPLDDEADEGLDPEGAMQAIVDELEEDLGDDHEDPSAVSMQVGSSGRVTAHDEHGTRIPTPTQSQTATPSRSAPLRGESSLARNLLASLPNRSMSYAAAASAAPADWHLEFSVNGQRISSATTIYRAVHTSHLSEADRHGRSTWATVHTINIKRVPGPSPVEPNVLHNDPEPLTGNALPESLEKNPITAGILRLLDILHQMNVNLDDVLTENQLTVKVNAEPLAAFVNTKLTAKLNRQLEEPLIVASNTLPSWSEDLARLYPFLFPFESRHLFLQSTSFGYSRSMTRWQNNQGNDSSRRNRDDRPYLGRLQRQKVRISRVKLLESAIKVMELYGASPSVLEVEYFEEVGTGLGPTLEFYSNVSKEFSKKKLRLWRENETADKEAYAYGKRGLFPAPMSEAQLADENGQKVLMLFKMLGKFVARSMLDSRIIDISFNPTFFRASFDSDELLLGLAAVKSVDETLAQSLQTLRQLALAKKKVDEKPGLSLTQKAQKISRIHVNGVSVDDMSLDFTLPGYPTIELIPNGAETPVTIENVGLYVDKVVDYTLKSGVQQQIQAFRTGFSQVFPYNALRAFTPDELVMLFGRVNEDWSIETLMDSIKADHGYNMDSKSVRNLLQIMSELSLPARRDFLQFITGSPKLPIGGFKSLTPMLTIVLRPAESGNGPDATLPSVMTCQNYVKLPDYSSVEVMRARLQIAIKEGAGAFHLS